MSIRQYLVQCACQPADVGDGGGFGGAVGGGKACGMRGSGKAEGEDDVVQLGSDVVVQRADDGRDVGGLGVCCPGGRVCQRQQADL